MKIILIAFLAFLCASVSIIIIDIVKEKLIYGFVKFEGVGERITGVFVGCAVTAFAFYITH